MAVRSVLQIVLDEALEVLGALDDWVRLAPYCPNCLSLPRCSHQAGCPLGRVARLRRLLDSREQRRRDDDLAALRCERAEIAATSKGIALAGASATLADGEPSALPNQQPPSPHMIAGARSHDDAPSDLLARVESDERARAFVIDALEHTATRCFAEASAMRARSSGVSANAIHAQAAALHDRAGRYAEAAAWWLVRNGASALLGQAALLGSLGREATPSAAEPQRGPR